MLTLRPARLSEADDLTELCMRAKAVWGYDVGFMAACRSELTITPEKMRTSLVHVAELGGRVVGVARLSIAEETAELAALFVEPDAQGSGVGRSLFEWALVTCRARGVRTVMIESDPGAAPFYLRMGAREVGSVSSGSIPGRVLPKLELALGRSIDSTAPKL